MGLSISSQRGDGGKVVLDNGEVRVKQARPAPEFAKASLKYTEGSLRRARSAVVPKLKNGLEAGA